MSEFCQIATTIGTRHEAERIATELVDRRLAACVQVSGPIQSTYRWQGQIENSEEWVCTAKTSRDKFTAVAEVIGKLHPYEVPEIVATPILEASAAYLDWMRTQLD
jgi:periplasmic divalent cation tolerance protein